MNATKHELLVFSRKEAVVILVLLVLVAMFSFTIGLKTGKDLAVIQGGTPHTSDSDGHESEHDGHGAGARLQPDHGVAYEAESSTEPHNAEAAIHATQSVQSAARLTGKQLLDQTTDRVAATETSIVAEQKVVTSLPQKKKAAVTQAMYTLQLGAYRNMADATEQVAILKRQGHENAFYFEAQVPGKGLWYRVGLGRYDSKAKAEAAGKTIADAHKDIPAYIVQQVDQ